MTQPKNPDHALVKATRLNGMVEVFKHDAMQDAAILQVGRDRAPELLDAEEGIALAKKTNEELAALGWTRRQLYVAIDHKKSRKDAPVYIQFAQERQALRMRTLPSDGGDGDTAHGFVIPVTEARPPEADEDDGGDEP